MFLEPYVYKHLVPKELVVWPQILLKNKKLEICCIECRVGRLKNARLHFPFTVFTFQ